MTESKSAQQPLPPAAAGAPATTAVTVQSEAEKAEALVVSDRRLLKLRSTLDNLRPWFANALPKHIPSERFVRVVVGAVQRTPKLLECDPSSLFAALLQCAALGLEPDGLLGQAYLIPFGKLVQFIPGYRGLIKLVRQSGEMAGVYARVVRARDQFSYAYGLDEQLEHVPHRGPDPGPLVAVYAVARFKGNEDLPQFDVMEAWEVDRIRAMSQGFQRAERNGKDSPWHQHYDAMAMKTVLRRLCKMLPQSVDKDHLARAVALDEQAEANIAQQFGDVDPEALAKIEPERPEVTPETQGRRLPLGTRGARSESKKTLTIDTSAIDKPGDQPPIPLEEMTDKERDEWKASHPDSVDHLK
jgi:recombination protein RecT